MKLTVINIIIRLLLERLEKVTDIVFDQEYAYALQNVWGAKIENSKVGQRFAKLSYCA